MKKTKLNLTIDAIMFIVMMAVAGIGFLIKYVLVPGFKRNEIYGKDVELYFWGMDRHQWGSIHLILSFTLLFLLLLHLIFHWKQIVCIFKCMVAVKTWRIIITSTIVCFTFVLAIVPLFIQPEIKAELAQHKYRDENEKMNRKKKLAESTSKHSIFSDTHKIKIEEKQNVSELNEKKPKSDIHEHHEQRDIEVFGFMTLDEVGQKYNVTVSELARIIKVPQSSSNIRLGRLRKQYHFELHDLRDYIEQKMKEE